MLLLAALAGMVLTLIGIAAERKRLHLRFQANTIRHRRVLSLVIPSFSALQTHPRSVSSTSKTHCMHLNIMKSFSNLWGSMNVAPISGPSRKFVWHLFWHLFCTYSGCNRVSLIQRPKAERESVSVATFKIRVAPNSHLTRAQRALPIHNLLNGRRRPAAVVLLYRHSNLAIHEDNVSLATFQLVPSRRESLSMPLLKYILRRLLFPGYDPLTSTFAIRAQSGKTKVCDRLFWSRETPRFSITPAQISAPPPPLPSLSTRLQTQLVSS